MAKATQSNNKNWPLSLPAYQILNNKCMHGWFGIPFNVYPSEYYYRTLLVLYFQITPPVVKSNDLINTLIMGQ